MSWPSVLVARIRSLVQRSRVERELDDEVRFHLEMQVEDNLKAGMSPDEARSAARRSFGAIEPMKERHRDRRAFAQAETVLQDIRFAIRTLRRSPGFTIASVATLALAIGANTTMFSVLNAVLLRPLPYRSPEQLAMVWTEMPSQGLRETRSAYLTVEQWRRQSTSFADLAVMDGVSAIFTRAGDAQQVSVGRVSSNFFSLLGVPLVEGRNFTAEEAEQRQRLALISHRFWQSHFAGARDALGSVLELEGGPARIIGILPADSRFGLFDADVWEPHTLFPDWDARRVARGSGPWLVVGRLRPGITISQAEAEMNVIGRGLDEQLPAGERGRGISIVPLSNQITGARPRLALWMLTCAAFCVLLIAATNVAGLALARSVSREGEIAIRAALGAGHGRIVRQLLTESLTLAVAAGALGLFIAIAGIRIIRIRRPVNLPRLEDIGLDGRVLASSLALCLLTGLLVGLAPALTMARRSLRLDGGRRSSSGSIARRVRRTLVVAEFALAIVLLVGAGLLIRSLWSIQRVDLGFRPERVLSLQLSTAALKTSGQQVDFYNRMLEQIHAVPGVEGVGIIGDLFVGGSTEQIITIQGNDRVVSERLRLRRDEVSDGLFTTLGTPLLRGRFFSPVEDRPESPRVAIINETMARRLWFGRDALGQRFRLGTPASQAPWFTVVGVVGDMRRQGLENEPSAQMFEPLAQNPSRLGTLLVRTSDDDPLKIVGVLRTAIRGTDARAHVYGVTSLEQRLGAFLTQRRFETSLLIGFSIVALLMASIGIYGLIQYSIVTRTHEIAIRMAIGAHTGEIIRMILREGLELTVTGLVVGLAGAVWLGQAGSSLLFGVTATDPATLLTVSLLLAAVATAACYFPARRTLKVEPAMALRQA